MVAPARFGAMGYLDGTGLDGVSGRRGLTRFPGCLVKIFPYFGQPILRLDWNLALYSSSQMPVPSAIRPLRIALQNSISSRPSRGMKLKSLPVSILIFTGYHIDVEISA
jgi:hypothetical protein